MVTKGEVYRHFKGGVYGVVEVATDHDSKELCVVYRNLETSECYVRRMCDFESKAIGGVQRFTLIDRVDIKN